MRVEYLAHKNECISLEKVDQPFRDFDFFKIYTDSGSGESITPRDTELAYIGEVSYKRICEIYKIKYNGK